MSVVTIDEIENLPNRTGVFLIDVRDPPEIASTGLIPTSINIPCKLICFVLMKSCHYMLIGEHLNIPIGELKVCCACVFVRNHISDVCIS